MAASFERALKFSPAQPRTPKGVTWAPTGPAPGRWSKASQSGLWALQSSLNPRGLPMDEASRLSRAQAMGFDTTHAWYHGTLSDFTQFEEQFASTQAYWGPAFYFSDDPADVEMNYTNPDSPDWQAKIDNKIEQEMQKWRDEHRDATLDDENAAAHEIEARIKGQIGDDAGVMLETFLKITNPFDMTTNNVVLPIEEEYDAETEEYTGEVSGKGFEFIEALEGIAVMRYNLNSSKVARAKFDELKTSLWEELGSGGSTPKRIWKILHEHEGLIYLEDDMGNSVPPGRIVAEALQEVGFDAIIMDAYEHFPKIVPAPGTKHAIVFDPTQIRLTTAVFDPEQADSKDIRKFDPKQPRAPKGSSIGGRWIDSVKFTSELTDAYSGQTNHRVTAEQNGKVLGRLSYSVYGGEAQVDMIEVDPEYRRRGIATRLMQPLIEHAKEKGLKVTTSLQLPEGAEFFRAYGSLPDFRQSDPRGLELLESDPPLNEGLKAAEESWRGGVADFGDPEAATLIQGMKGYFDYRSHLEEKARDLFGDSFPMYRSVTQEELDSWQAGADLPPRGMTFNPQLAYRWSQLAQNTTPRRVVQLTVRPEAIVMRGKIEEEELVIDPNYISFDTVRIEKYDPNQPREPAGTSIGGRWAKALHSSARNLWASTPTESTSPYRKHLPKVRGGWTMDKIKRELRKSGSLHEPHSFAKAITEFSSPEEFAQHLFWHGTGGGVSGGLKAGGVLPKDAFRSGGYDERYHTISLSRSKRMAAAFTGDSSFGSVYMVVLRKGAKVIDMPEVQDSIELEEHLPRLWAEGVDAVRIGKWDDGSSEQELSVLNPRAIVLGPSEGFQVYQMRGLTPAPDSEALRALYEKAQQDHAQWLAEAPQRQAKRRAETIARWQAQFPDRPIPEWMVQKYVPSQPREPKGTPIGGRWTKTGHYTGPLPRGGTFRAKVRSLSMSFNSQKNQYPDHGPTGISYYPGYLNDPGDHVVDCLLYRNEDGKLIGILNHFGFDLPPYQKKGDVLVMVDPKHQRKGIGTALLREAGKLYDIDLSTQKFTKEGAALANAVSNPWYTDKDPPPEDWGKKVRKVAVEQGGPWRYPFPFLPTPQAVGGPVIPTDAYNPYVRKYDPQQPRHPKGTSQGGRWSRVLHTSSLTPSSVNMTTWASKPAKAPPGHTRLYHGGANVEVLSLDAADPRALFGAGIYLTNSPRLSNDYMTVRGLSETAGVTRISGGGPKAKAIERFLRLKAMYEIGPDGKKFEGDAPEWPVMDYEQAPRIAGARKWWEREKKNWLVRRQVDGTWLFAPKQKLKTTRHEYDIPNEMLDGMLNAESEVDDKAVSALADALKTMGDRNTADAIWDFVESRRRAANWDEVDEDGNSVSPPTYRDIYTSITRNSPLISPEGQVELRRNLKEAGYTGIRYQGGLTMGGQNHEAYVIWDEQGLRKWRRDKAKKYEIALKFNPNQARYPKGTPWASQGPGPGRFSPSRRGPITLSLESFEYKRPGVRNITKVPALLNPSRSELMRWAGGEVKQVRWLSWNGNTVFWNSYEGLHQQVANALLREGIAHEEDFDHAYWNENDQSRIDVLAGDSPLSEFRLPGSTLYDDLFQPEPKGVWAMQSDYTGPAFTLQKVKVGDGVAHKIFVNDAFVGHISGFEEPDVTKVNGEWVSTDRLQIYKTELSHEPLKGTGLYRKALQQVADQYPGGAYTFEWWSSTALKKSIRKMPTFEQEGDRMFVRPTKWPIRKYDPRQPRHPKGSSQGGRWAKLLSGLNLWAKGNSTYKEVPLTGSRKLRVQNQSPNRENFHRTAKHVEVLFNPTKEELLRWMSRAGDDGEGIEDIRFMPFGFKQVAFWNAYEMHHSGMIDMFHANNIVTMEMLEAINYETAETLNWWFEDMSGELTKNDIESSRFDVLFEPYATRPRTWQAGQEWERNRAIKKYDPSQPRHPKGMREGGRWSKMLGAGSTLWAQQAFHGSPHHGIERFDLSRIGTGEGAQAFGWGMYFAELPGVARGYAHKLTNEDPNTIAGWALGLHGGSMRQAIKALRSGKAVGGIFMPQHLFNQAADLLETGKYKHTGSLYTVEIPDGVIDRMLNWDAPMGEQPQSLLDALSKQTQVLVEKDGKWYHGAVHPTREVKTGKDLYERLVGKREMFDPKGWEAQAKSASNVLRSLGVPGVRYYDRGSRPAGKKGKRTRNYVIWDQDVLDRMAVNVVKYDPAQPRWPAGSGDKSGEWKPVVDSMVLHPVDKRAGYKLVTLDMAKMDEAWARSEGFYVGKGGTGAAIGDRYKRFQEFLKRGIPVQAPNISISVGPHRGVADVPGVDFGDGRHRTAVLRDMGASYIKVALDAESVKLAKKLGWVVTPTKKMLEVFKYDPSQPRHPKGTSEGGRWSKGQGGLWLQRAFHGTRAKGISRFDLKYVGSGEGNTTYGWGMYFAQSKGVGKHYQTGLSNPGSQGVTAYKIVDLGAGEGPLVIMRSTDEWAPGSKTTYLDWKPTGPDFKTKQEAYDWLKGTGKIDDEWRFGIFDDAKYQEVESLEDADILMPSGYLYTVDIPESLAPRMLDWDAPLIDQPAVVRKNLEKLWGGPVPEKNSTGEVLKGSDVYERLKARMGSVHGDAMMREAGIEGLSRSGVSRLASEYLRFMGVPGLHYLDQDSRWRGNGTRNYVIWDQATLDEIQVVEVTRKFDPNQPRDPKGTPTGGWWTSKYSGKQADWMREHKAKQKAFAKSNPKGIRYDAELNGERVPLSALTEQMKFMAQVQQGNAQQHGVRYGGMEAFVLAKGQEFDVPDSPPAIALMTPKECFANAVKFMDKDGSLYADTSKYQYAEGFVISPRLPFPIHHAWIVNRETGLVIDPTLGWQPKARYFGVAFETPFLRKKLVKQGYYGLLSGDVMVHDLVLGRDSDFDYGAP